MKNLMIFFVSLLSLGLIVGTYFLGISISEGMKITMVVTLMVLTAILNLCFIGLLSVEIKNENKRKLDEKLGKNLLFCPYGNLKSFEEAVEKGNCCTFSGDCLFRRKCNALLAEIYEKKHTEKEKVA